jgi:DNA uptake protein ComE-like DNA-binding protein
VIRLCLLLLLASTPLLFGNLETFPNCTLVSSEWADGDSFPVRFPDGKERTIRLYGADCMEMHLQGDDSNARRLRDQRRYFGIADIQLARQLGIDAKNTVQQWLQKPFTVHTAFADGRGDNRFQRVYAFVTLHDGRDLAEALVSTGLARAFGVTRLRPDSTRADEWAEQLKDLELTAARKSLGAWKHTDWDKLTAFRKEARDEVAEIEIAKDQQKADPANQIDLNTASRDELMTIPGIGETTANQIISARPFRQLGDLLKVPGIGTTKFQKFRPYLKVTPPKS